MVEVIYQFLINMIGDIPLNDTITLMKLISYVATFLVLCICISPIFALIKNAFPKRRK